MRSNSEIKVLLCDDDADLCESLEFGFRRKGFQVSSVKNGLEALDFLQKNPLPDVMISDIQMPKLDGLALVDAVKMRFGEQSPILICMSAFSDLSLKDFYIKGVDGFFLKPVSAEALIAATLHFVGLHDQQRSSEMLIEAQRQKLIFADKMASLGEMASGIAHEINNPLTAILSYSKMLLTTLESDGGQSSAEKSKSVEYSKKIQSMGVMIEKIVKGLKTFTREGSKDPFTQTPLKNILNDAIELCSGFLKRQGVQIEKPNLSETLALDCRPSEICQVLVNLIKNSCDALENSQEKWIRFQIVNTELEVQIIVSDSGPGIPEEIREKIFDSFFTTKKVGLGTGLGLSISKKIVESHHGEFSLLNGSENQTQFVIRLPLKQN